MQSWFIRILVCVFVAGITAFPGRTNIEKPPTAAPPPQLKTGVSPQVVKTVDSPLWIRGFSGFFAGLCGDESGRFAAALPAGDRGFILAGSVAASSDIPGDACYFSHAFVMKLSSAGNLRWKKLFSANHWDDDMAHFDSLIRTQTGNFLVAGVAFYNRRIVLTKFNSAGQVKWYKSYRYKSRRMYYHHAFLTETTDGGYAVAAGVMEEDSDDNETDIWIFKVDAKGNILWQKVLDLNKYDYPNSLQATLDGGTVLAGSSDPDPSGKGRAFVLSMAADGLMKWLKYFSEDPSGQTSATQGRSITCEKDGSFMLAGTKTIYFENGFSDSKPWLAKIDPTGEIVWQRGIDASGSCRQLVQIRDGGFALATNEAFYKLDPAGIVQWKKFRGYSSYPRCSRIAFQREDGGFFVLGYDYYGEEESSMPLAMNLDENASTKSPFCGDIHDSTPSEWVPALTAQDGEYRVYEIPATVDILRYKPRHRRCTVYKICG